MKRQPSKFWTGTLFIMAAFVMVCLGTQPLLAQQGSTEERIIRLEARVAALAEANAENHRFLQIITFVGTAIGFLMGLDRYREGSRTETLRKEYSDKFTKYQEENRAGRDRQEQKQSELIDAARGNIDAASGLFEALGSMLQLQHTARAMGETIKELEGKAEEQVRLRRSVIEEQNRNAIDILKVVDRSNYASIDPQERFHEFAARLSSRKQEFTHYHQSGEVKCGQIFYRDTIWQERTTNGRKHVLWKSETFSRQESGAPEYRETFKTARSP